jgi:phosphoribosylglycinamide formyltransferase 2
MSSSGKGQGTIRSLDDLAIRWQEAMDGARGKSKRVIIEGFVQFDYEITLLTVSHRDGISFCEPIGHRQERGDYQESWQPQPMSELALSRAKEMASKVVSSLGGWGIFGVEFFVQGDTVYFSELSPRPHDTGLVTLISQDLSEFALHARAILGLPIPQIELLSPAASKAILVHGVSKQVKFGRLEEVLSAEGTSIRLFGKPEVNGERRMGVMLAKAKNVDEAIAKVIEATSKLNIQL